MFKSLLRISSLTLVGAAACGVGCQDDASPSGQAGQVELQLATCGSSADQIRGCVNGAGTLRVLSGSQTCSPAEKALCWNQVGPKGSNGLTAVSTLPAGDTHCPAGGSKLTVGVDTNGNGKLDDTEVTGFSFVCNGAPGATGPQGVTGATGAAGPNSLIRTTAEPAGSHCASGGQKIETGLDANGNGVLDDGEVIASATAYLCNGPCPPGYADCDGNVANGCETSITNPTNCGGCGVVCSGNTPFCGGGQCRGCDLYYPGTLTCNGYCVWPGDPSNCGSCGVVCSGNTPVCNATQCSPCGDVYSGALTCNGSCVWPDWDTNNCGGCGTVCSGNTPFCNAGTCAGCEVVYPGTLTCNGTCVSPDTDTNNCGSCGTVCSGNTPFCNAGKCAGCEDVYPGTLACNGSCVWQDTFNCGSCGNACATGQVCSGGTCVAGWDLARDLLANVESSAPTNPFADSHGNPAVWHMMVASGVDYDPTTYSDIPNDSFVRDTAGGCSTPGYSGWFFSDPMTGRMAQASINTSATTVSGYSCTGYQILNPFTASAHPGPSNLVLFAWQSPTSGPVSIVGRFSDADCSCGNGIVWHVDQWSAGTVTTIASGAIAECGSAPVKVQTTVAVGEYLYFIVDPNNDYSCDLTEIAAAIASI
jgi:hypothetical protein